MTKYLFLDVDGVLNHLQTFKKRNKNSINQDLDPKCLNNLYLITSKIQDIKIILTSSWRLIPCDLDRLELAFKNYHIPKWIDVTPYMDYEKGKTRGNEIRAWMKKHNVLSQQIVILDDNNDMGSLKHRLIQTSFTDGGLDLEHTKQVIALFKKMDHLKETNS